MMFTITDYAMKRSRKLHVHEPKMWGNLKGQFTKSHRRMPEINEDLNAAGRCPLGSDLMQ
ncbi:hypothetical protein BYT27DRAFT_7187135 [Phlegmacium glaucopus]|nr:hypothetical protein BYT27DRAFT_7187135 [Phlegmacium glaucopus]